MRRSAHRPPRGVLAAAVLLCVALVLPACGGGGLAGPYTTITVQNDAQSAFSITRVDFEYFSFAGLPTEQHPSDIRPGGTARYDFSQFESDNFLDMTIHWGDGTTSVYPLIGSSGGNFTFTPFH